MASLSHDPASGRFRVHFRYGGKQFQKSLKTTNARDAEAQRGCIEQTLSDLERGRLTLPLDADFWQFIRSDGKLDRKAELPSVASLGGLFEWYFGQQIPNSKEANTLRTEQIHSKHFARILGPKTVLGAIGPQELQRYVNERARERHRGKLIRRETIQKEIKTLQMVWNRAAKLGQVQKTAPTDGLEYPKGKNKLPFQTWEEIERNIARGGLTPDEVREQWASLFLSRQQIEEVLTFGRERKTTSTYFYPLLVFAAHTGARRSEMMRSRVEDFKFDTGKTGEVLIREKKKDRTKETFRRVPLSPLLRETMKKWLAVGHPGGVFTICRKENEAMQDRTMHEAFEWFFGGSKWAVLRGYHVFRHSFASNLAREGIDQRVIDELMGHETEEMQKRYRHLFPEQRDGAITKLFG